MGHKSNITSIDQKFYLEGPTMGISGRRKNILPPSFSVKRGVYEGGGVAWPVKKLNYTSFSCCRKTISCERTRKASKQASTGAGIP